MSRLVSVFGATGAQGGSVVRALLKEPSKWKVVALTRDVNSEKAKQLKALGAELRPCDMLKPDDVESALKVFTSFLCVCVVLYEVLCYVLS